MIIKQTLQIQDRKKVKALIASWGFSAISVNFPLKQNMKAIQSANDQLGIWLYYCQKGSQNGQ